jgi:hypothetical protein
MDFSYELDRQYAFVLERRVEDTALVLSASSEC